MSARPHSTTMPGISWCAWVFSFAAMAWVQGAPVQGAVPKPNIIVILADDLGYADLGCQGSREALTPEIDRIAEHGVRCTDGYVSAPQCCPSRAGLITGRYQNRFGFEANWPAPLSGKAGLPVTERTMADRLKAAGYATGMIGKWHLGDAEAMRPYNRGFDETLWHANGGVLFPEKATGYIRGLFRGPEPAQVAEYSTDAFGREAVEFIGRHADRPFFLYLAFVPPHWPMEAKPEDMARFSQIPDLHRRTMLAMMASLDTNIGRVMGKLRESGLEEKTLVFFLSDNGGPTGKPRVRPDAPFEYGQNTSRNDPFRGVKGELLEGGIRVPFLIQWKGRLPAGKVYGQPVISLDILPTALAAAGEAIDPQLDGVNLLPFLAGERAGTPHERLYWRFRFPSNQVSRHRWAIRQGDWKLVKNDTEPIALYDLATDVSETRNLAAEQPAVLREMETAWRAWDATLKDPLWKDMRPVIRSARDAKPAIFRAEIRVECTGNDPQIVVGDIAPTEGPLRLELKLKSTTRGPGQVFWSRGSVPKFAPSDSVEFKLNHGGAEWHSHAIELPTDGRVTYLRLDPGSGPGIVRIARMVLKDSRGKTVGSWMPPAESQSMTDRRDSK